MTKECKGCIHYDTCGYCDPMPTDCALYMRAKDCVEVIRCKECTHSKKINRNKAPDKYYSEQCIVCTCPDVVGDKPMIYWNTHYCSFGERRHK